MIISNVIEGIERALKQMDKKFCRLSENDYSTLDGRIKKQAKSEKYLERPIAYEFYHQLRKMIETGIVDFGGPIIQAEVDKRYQHCFEKGKIPDFIIHVPNSRHNLAVIEFKLTSNLDNINSDFLKLLEFKDNPELRYDNIIQVIIGNKASLNEAKDKIKQMKKTKGNEIKILQFNTDSWNVTDVYSIRYKYS